MIAMAILLVPVRVIAPVGLFAQKERIGGIVRDAGNAHERVANQYTFGATDANGGYVRALAAIGSVGGVKNAVSDVRVTAPAIAV